MRLHSFVALCLAPAALAQIPVGQAVNGCIGNAFPPLVVFDRAGGFALVTGSSLSNFNAVAIDPIDGSLWLAGWTGSDVRRAVLSGTTITREVIMVTAPPPSVAAIAFDVDCHALAVGGAIDTANGGVFRINRHTGSVSRVFGGPGTGLTGTVNAAESDPATGDLYLGLAGTGQVWRLSPPHYNVATLMGTANGVTTIAGITLARPPAAPLGLLYLACFGTAANNSLQSIDVATGTTSVIPGVPALPDLNWVDYDDVMGDLWINGTAQSGRVMRSTVLGVNVLLRRFTTGSPASIEVNDVRTDAAALTVAPRYLPAGSTPIELELGVAGRPGEFGLVAMTAPFAMLLGFGVVDSGGRFAVTLPRVEMTAGAPGSVQLAAATVDLATLAIKVSPLVAWPGN